MGKGAEKKRKCGRDTVCASMLQSSPLTRITKISIIIIIINRKNIE